MSQDLAELFKHHLWANLRLLDVCAQLGDEQLEASAPGTYGTIRDTLIHLLMTEERYLESLQGQPVAFRPAPPFPGFEALREQARQSGEALITYAENLPDAVQTFQGSFNGQPFTMRVIVPLLQAIHHATEHRVHITTILSQQGVEPPILDAWTYERERISA